MDIAFSQTNKFFFQLFFGIHLTMLIGAFQATFLHFLPVIFDNFTFNLSMLEFYFQNACINPLMPGGNKKLTYNETNLQLKAVCLSMCDLFVTTSH